MQKFDFTKAEYEQIIDKLMLNDEMSSILKLRIQNNSITQISMKLNISESTVSRRIKKLKKMIEKVI